MFDLVKKNWGFFLTLVLWGGSFCAMELKKEVRLDAQEVVRYDKPGLGWIDLSGRGYTDVSGVDQLKVFVDGPGIDTDNVSIRDVEKPRIDLSHNQLKALPNQLTSLTQLQALRLDHNCFEEIPEVVCQMTSLDCLSLKQNKLKTINQNISRLTNVRGLYLGFNSEITELPSLSGLAKLWWLHVNDLSLNRIPDIKDMPSTVCQLNFTNNFIACMIPCSVPEYSNLTTLNLASNNLKNIPAAIKHLSNLVNLDLTNNAISELPPEIGTLQKLNWCILNNNDIQEIPECISNLRLCLHLQLLDNELQNLQATKHNSPKLFRYLSILISRGLFWFGCPLKPIKKLPKEIRRMIYYHTLQ